MFFFKNKEKTAKKAAKKPNKKSKKIDKYIDPQLESDAQFSDFSDKNDEEYQLIEQMQYIRTQCEQVVDSTRYIEELKMEHQIVNNYISDVKIIEAQKDTGKKSLKTISSEILKLESRRESIRKRAPLISTAKYTMFEQYEDDFPKLLTDFMNDEKYCQNVRHDLRILEAEKRALREDIEEFESRRVGIRNIGIISCVGILVVYIIFFASGQLQNEDGMTMFMVVLLMSAVFILLICLLLRNVSYRTKISEKKLSKAITLLNKTKIKYVNIHNSVEYQKAKYGVHNSLELSKEYEAYLTEKQKEENFKKSSSELMDATEHFAEKIKALNLYDSSIWEKQVEVFSDEKALSDVKQTLSLRRQKLRERMDYNMDRVEESKKLIIKFIDMHPELSNEVMGIVDSYNIDF